MSDMTNQAAPDFHLSDQNGVMHSLADYRGTWLVLYFYPKDDTPGCTTEACSFRDARELIAQLGGAEVAGVSKDSVASHKKFVTKHHLNFTLLSDPDHRVIAAYGSWQPRKFMGRDFLGTERNTFIIDPSGIIAKEYRGVDPQTHAAQIIKDLQALEQAAR
ncbi:MAG TPA: peroxiredoxin [Candidatus Saccharimonadales bacterium]|nr:peroxiredoxin [Candidatus Saccharimonadales bacterium]